MFVGADVFCDGVSGDNLSKTFTVVSVGVFPLSFNDVD